MKKATEKLGTETKKGVLHTFADRVNTGLDKTRTFVQNVINAPKTICVKTFGFCKTATINAYKFVKEPAVSFVHRTAYALRKTIYETVSTAMPIIRIINTCLTLAVLVTFAPSLKIIQAQILPVYIATMFTYFIMSFMFAHKKNHNQNNKEEQGKEHQS